MRIAYVSAHYSPFVGGVESHVIQIAQRAAARGHDVDVLTHDESDPLPAEETLSGVRVRRFRVPVPSRNYAVSPTLWTYLARESSKYDLVHAHGYHALPALAAALCKRTALVFTPHYHGTGHSPFRRLLHRPYRRLGALIFARAERTIAVSPSEAELILSHFPQVAPRLAVIPNGVDRELIDDAVPFDGPETIILSAGRIESYKQVDKTVSAMSFLSDQFALRVTGDGAARASAETLADRLGLEARARFLGQVPQDELYRWFKTARVYVSMSSNEAMPVTIVETLAAGARVVASDIPAHRSLMDKTNGTMTLVPLTASPEELARAIAEISDAPRVEPRVDSWDTITDTTLRLYEAAIAETATRQ